MDSMLLTLLTLSPLLGLIVLALIPRSQVGTIKLIGILATVLPLILSLILYAGFSFNNAGLQFAEKVNWFAIPAEQVSFPI